MPVVGNWVPSGNDQQRLQSLLRGAVQYLQMATDQLNALHNLMSQMAPAGVYSDVETYFGLTPGSGQTVHDLVGSAAVDLQGGNVQGLLQRLA